MTTPDEPHDDLHDDELSRRYHALSPELPHPDTDAAIRSAAREAVVIAPRRSHNLTMYGGLAMAASVTLMVAILLPSWRSGVLREEVAVQQAAPAMAPAAEAEAVMEDAISARATGMAATPTLPHAEVASEGALEERRSPARASNVQRKSEVASIPAPALAPAAEPVSESAVPASPPAMSKPAVVASAPMPALAEADMAAAGARAQESRERVMEEQKAQVAAKQEPLSRQKAGLARAPSEVASSAPQADEVPALHALLQGGRYDEALVLLQTGPAATNPALDSRRDLLRQLLPGQNKALTCRPDSGPASSRALCVLLIAYQDHQPLEDRQDALWQALVAEGTSPVPWLQAVSQLP